MEVKPWTRGSVILMHDGGGNRQPTIDALPILIDALRAHGYEIVPISQLIGKTRDEVMPPIKGRQRYYAWIDSIAFFMSFAPRSAATSFLAAMCSGVSCPRQRVNPK